MPRFPRPHSPTGKPGSNGAEKATNQEQSLADDKMRAEIAKLLARTKPIGINTFLAPALVAAMLMGGTAAVVKLFF